MAQSCHDMLPVLHKLTWLCVQLTRRLALLDAVQAWVKRAVKDPSGNLAVPGDLPATQVQTLCCLLSSIEGALHDCLHSLRLSSSALASQ